MWWSLERALFPPFFCKIVSHNDRPRPAATRFPFKPNMSNPLRLVHEYSKFNPKLPRKVANMPYAIYKEWLDLKLKLNSGGQHHFFRKAKDYSCPFRQL